jgi:arylsulfatase A-like enzyme
LERSRPAPDRRRRPFGAERRPNVIFIVADDLGYGDLGSYGGPIPTPHLDALAASGARMKAGYVTAAVCAPSRAALITGRHQSRFGFEFNPVGRDEQRGLPPGESTMAESLKQAGYATGAVGKWHLGQAAGFHPLDRGFDSYFGVLGGATSFWKTQGPGDERAPTAEDRYINRQRLPIYRGREVVNPDGYFTDVLTDEAVGFIDRHKSQPFFLYLAYTAPHTPLEASAKYIERFKHVEDQHARVYRAMVSAMDDGVGKLRAKLRAEGLDDDTLIVFVSDNGCANYVRGACSNGPLSGAKGYPWEGGIRVPFLVSWPGVIRPSAPDAPVSILDVRPTVAAATGATPIEGGGVNLLPALSGRGALDSQRTLHWKTGPNYAIRDGRWKLLVVNKSDRGEKDTTESVGQPLPDGVPARVSPLGQHVLLFDLQNDPGETVDLAARHPEVVRRLQQRWAEWDRGNVAPMWTSRRQFQLEHQGRKIELFN